MADNTRFNLVIVRRKFCQRSELTRCKSEMCRRQKWTHSSISQAPVQYLTPAFNPADLPSSLIRKSNSKPFLTRHRSCLFPQDAINNRPSTLPKVNSRSHSQQGAEIIASIANVDNLFVIVHLLAVLFQPAFQLVSLAHVDQTSDLA